MYINRDKDIIQLNKQYLQTHTQIYCRRNNHNHSHGRTYLSEGPFSQNYIIMLTYIYKYIYIYKYKCTQS